MSSDGKRYTEAQCEEYTKNIYPNDLVVAAVFQMCDGNLYRLFDQYNERRLYYALRRELRGVDKSVEDMLHGDDYKIQELLNGEYSGLRGMRVYCRKISQQGVRYKESQYKPYSDVFYAAADDIEYLCEKYQRTDNAKIERMIKSHTQQIAALEDKLSFALDSLEALEKNR